MSTLEHSMIGVGGRSYAGERWAQAVLKVIVADVDPRTFAGWARLIGASTATLGTWCRAARVSPRRSTELARLSRALHLTGGMLTDLQEVLDIIDPRTVKRLLTRAGVDGIDGPLPLQEFLREQRLVQNPTALHALTLALAARGIQSTDGGPASVDLIA